MLDWMLPRTHLLKISDEDLQLLRPGDERRRSSPAAALRRGVKLVVVTRGAAGRRGVDARRRTPRCRRCRSQVIDTVGAGDTFQAALLTWLAEHDALSAAGAAIAGRGAELRSALAFAARAAAHHLLAARRRPASPRRAALKLGD